MSCNKMSRQRFCRSKRRHSRRGIATVEFALCLPLLALICFGSIQVSSSIILRHKTVAILEIATLDYMLGKVSEAELTGHLESLSNEFELTGGSATVVVETINDVTFLRVQLSLPIDENLVAPMFVGSPPELNTQVLIYRP